MHVIEFLQLKMETIFSLKKQALMLRLWSLMVTFFLKHLEKNFFGEKIKEIHNKIIFKRF